MYKENKLFSHQSEACGYDNLNQLTGYARGTLDANKDGISGTPSRSQSWDYDQLGNFNRVTTNGNTQSRSHNAQNEIGTIGSATLQYDANGNLTKDETGRTYKYDAWNRLVEVKDSGGTTIRQYRYDALYRRIQEIAGSETRDLYYSSAWQVLEEHVNGQVESQYVWSPVYVDALILRDRDTDGNGSLDQRLYALHDANFNVTALVDSTGTVVERYQYDPFGAVTVLDPSGNVRVGGSLYAWKYLHQGGRLDSITGNYHFRFRDYSPSMGRWINLDPIGFAAGDQNLYRAIGNNPGNGVDPSGLWEIVHQALPQGKVQLEYRQGWWKRNPWYQNSYIGTLHQQGN